MSNSVYKFYIVCNSDLKMTPGQISSQVSHVTQIIVDHLVSLGYESFPIPAQVIQYNLWKANPVTVILKASGKELELLKELPNTKAFYDSGVRLGMNCLTVVGFFPSNTNDYLLSKFKLV